MIACILKRLFSIFSVFFAFVLFGVLALVMLRQVSPISAASTVDRNLEPVIVKGIFSGVPVDQIYVYREVGGAWEQIPFQIDEVTASGDYTSAENGELDSNDEIVFMAKDLGDQATTSITTSLPISAAWYEIEVTDPLNTTKKGWAYIVRSEVLVPNNAVDYVDYIAASQHVSTTNYTIGWATSHAGLDHISLFGGSDILDRTKVRIRYAFVINLTEDTLSKPPLILIKDGPMRVIVSRGAATTFAYASFLRTLTPIDLSTLPGTLNEVRLSTDLTDTAVGIYYNENLPGGVTIDGSPDTVPATPFISPWRQVSLNSGTIIQVVDTGSLGGSFSHYYKDDGTLDSADTGDQRSFGDSGVKVVNPTSKAFTVESVQYILPGQQGNRGAEFYNIFQNQLSVSILFEAPYKVYLPVVQKNN